MPDTLWHLTAELLWHFHYPQDDVSVWALLDIDHAREDIGIPSIFA